MHVWTWVVSGLIVAALARVAIGRWQFSVLGDFALGLLGAVGGGSVAHALGVATPSGATHAMGAGVGAVLLVAASRVVAAVFAPRQVMENGEAEPRPHLDLEAHLRRLGERERRILAKVLRREAVSRDTTVAFERQQTLGERVADQVAAFGGSWTFIFLFLALMAVWMAYNVESRAAYDPYPFILLNLVLSCLAAMQAPVIMMSQNRQAAKDRLDAQNDYQVNVKAELEVAALHLKLDELREQHVREIIAAQEQQRELLIRIERELSGLRARSDRAGSS